MANFCRECGAALLGRRFCSQCGKETAASASSIPAATSLGDPNPQSTLKRAGSVEIPPVAVGDEATTIYKRVVATVRGTHHGEQADNTVKDFKKDCKQYGAGAISAEAFEANLRVYLGEYMIDATMPQLVRLIHDDDKRAELVMVYHRQSKNKTKSRPASASSAVQRSTNLPPSSQLTVATPVEPPRSEGQARPPAKWSAPSLYTNQPVCDICSTPFDMMNRRHHCRKCGKSACQSCSPAHMLIPPGHQHAQAKGYDPAVPQRVCTLCAPVLQPLQARLEAAFANCHKEQPAAPTKGWFKSIPVKQTIEDECEMAQKMLRQFFLTSQVDKQIPITFLERAHGLAFLTVVKAGLLVTAKMGSGIVLTKFPDKTWSAPSAIGTAGLGGGFEGGGELVQILLLLGSAKAVSVFYQTQLTLGAGLDVTVGPYGRSATAQAAMSSSGGGLDVNYSYSHSRGLFAGISLHGAVINCRSDANRAFYGRHVTPMEILTGAVAPPRAAQGLYDAIEEAVQSCASFRDDQRTRQQRVCTQAGCPCEKFRAKTLSAKCANCVGQRGRQTDMATLDKIEWPEPQPVDLLREFPWVVGDARVTAPSTAQAERNVKITALHETSPYAEVFPQAHRVRPTLTPAQIAERRMERLVDKMDTAIASTSQPAVVVGHELRIQHGETEVDFAAWQSEAAACSSIPTATDKATTSSTSPETVESIPERIKSRQSVPSTSPTASRIKSLREIRQEVHRATNDDRDGLDLPRREFPQDPWITEQLDPVELTANLVLDVDAPDDKAADASQRSMAKYSVEMQERILSTMYATTGLDMWTDPVTSQLAAPLNSDAIFGAGTPGDAPPFDTGAIRLPDATALEATWIQQEAKQAFDNAAAHEQAGRPAQAIDALGDGIHAMLGATPAPWGFHYDLSAHKKASTIQRLYHRRYRLRSTAAVQVARVWRGFRTRRRLVKARRRADQSAARLQRWWHRCNRHRETMRLRLQTAMRAKLARLHVHALRQRRLLMRNLQLLVKAWRVQHNSLQALRRKHGYAHFCQLTKERWLRGVIARYRVRKLKRALQDEEAARYAAECAFVDLHLEPKLRDFQRLLKSTRGGAMRLSRLALRLKAEAVARDEARRHWSVADRRRAQIHDVFDTYDVDKSGTIDSNELRHLFDELGIAIDAGGLAEALKAMDADGSGSIEFDEFYAWLHAPPPPSSTSRHLREGSTLVFLKMKLNVKQFVNRFTDDSFAQHAARLLVFEESQKTQDALRKSFRVTRPPRFACRFCGTPFALYKAFWRHETAECGKNLCRRGASPEEDEALRIAHEQRAVQAALEDVTDAVHAYVATRPGRRTLQREIYRVQRLHKQTASATYVSERMKLRDLFLTYDLDDSNTLDEAEFSQISRDLGQPMSAAALSKAFRALDVDGSGKLSFDEFALWAMEQTVKVRKSWTKRLWALLVRRQQRRRQRRAEALRYIIAREKIFAEARARRAFREMFPPPFACPGCHAAFCREEAAATHAKFADAIHARQKDKLATLYARIGMTESSTSVLEAAARAVQDLKQMLAVQRYLQTRRGRYALETEVAVLKALREKAKVDPKLYVQGIVRAFAAEKTVLLRDVRHICRLLKRSTASATTTSAIRTLDPSGSGLVVESTLLAWLQDAAKARPVPRWRAQSPFWLHAKAKCIVTAKYKRYLDAGGIEITDDDDAATALSKDGRGSAAAVESDMDWLFQEYCQTSAGRDALRGEIHRLDNLQAKTTGQARASFIFEQLVNATGKTDGGERRLDVEDVAFALRQVGFPFDSRLWLELDPTATGSIALDSFQEWYAAVRKQLFETRIRRRNTRRLARALLAVRFQQQANAAARTNAAADGAHLLVTSKSEEFGKSSLGLPEVKMEVRRIQCLYDRMTLRSAAHLVAMAFDAFGMHGVVDNVDIGAVLYFANCPCDAASIDAIRRDSTAQIVHEDAVLTWLQQQTHGLHRFHRAATSCWRRFHRTDRIERLAKAIVGARQRRRLYQT